MTHKSLIWFSSHVVASLGVALTTSTAGAQPMAPQNPPPAVAPAPGTTQPSGDQGEPYAEPGATPVTPAPPPAATPPTPSEAPGAPSTEPGGMSPPVAPPPGPRRERPRKRSRHSYSGPPTLVGSMGELGGYGGISVDYARIADQSGAFVGVEGALLLDHRLALGLAGHGWTRHPSATPDPLDNEPRQLELGYGGLILRYGILTDELVHFTVGALVGGGAATLTRDDFDDNDDFDDFDDNDDGVDSDDVDPFFLVEPQLTAEMNIVPWLRVGAKVGYRLTAGVGKLDYTESDFNGIGAGAHVQVGWF